MARRLSIRIHSRERQTAPTIITRLFRKSKLFHLLTTVHVQDGAIHSLLLQIYVTPNYKIIDNPVYPDYLVPVLGKLSLRAPPFV